ncbi:MAG: hypothetical protein HOI14_03435 [Flavobacteriaceae bacterium]|nr:hypothetical protein [Flavobacteriaceae bacterium]
MRLLMLAFILSLFLSCKESETVLVKPDEPVENKTAEYTVTFSFNWNDNDFPVDYPTNPHFSPLVGWVHQKDNTFFDTGKTATDGIKIMAEVGGTATLIEELQALIDQKKGLKTYVGSGLGSGVGNVTLDVSISNEFPAISLATMLAPSPDWYIAAVNVILTDDDDNFIETKTIHGGVYDAGTDSGTTFTAANSATQPRENINIITQAPLGDGNGVKSSICSVTFTKK